MISSILNIIWIVIWPQGNICASFFVIFLLWQALATIYIKVANVTVEDQDIVEESDQEYIQTEDSEQVPLLYQLKKSDYEYLIVFIPFSLYFSWVTCATIVSLFLAFLPISGSNPFQTVPFAIMAILCLTIVASLFVLVQKDVIFGIVVIWALIAISQGSQLKMWPGYEANSIYITCLCSASLLMLIIILMIGMKIRLTNVNRTN